MTRPRQPIVAGRWATPAVIAVGAVLIAGCRSSSGASSGGSSSGTAPSTVVAAPSVLPSALPSSTLAGTPSTAPSIASSSGAAPTLTTSPAVSDRTTAAPSTSSTSSSAAPSASPTDPGPGACTATQLSAQGVRGGAYQGREIAGVVFTNASTTACNLRGYISAQLLRNGQPVGKPASDDPGRARNLLLRHGDSAQVELTAVSTCQAPISDHAIVRVPGDDTPITVALQLRACSLSVSPIEPS